MLNARASLEQTSPGSVEQRPYQSGKVEEVEEVEEVEKVSGEVGKWKSAVGVCRYICGAKLTGMVAVLWRRAAAVALLTASTGAHVAAQDNAALSVTPRFDVASVRINTSNERPRLRLRAIPETGTLTITGMTVQEVIQSAYAITPFELVTNGSPILKQRIDVVAKAAKPATAAEMQRMLQALLGQRFTLTTHRETREMDALLLVRVSDQRLGPKIKASTLGCTGVGITTMFAFNPGTPDGKDTRERCGVLPTDRPGRILANGIEMRGLAAEIPSLGRPVIDMTRMEGRYDLDLTWTPEAFTAAALGRRGGTPFPGVDPDGPTLTTALADQLGLRLEAKRAPVPVVVIDSIEALIAD